MIGLFVQFRYENGFDAQKIRAIAEGAKSMFAVRKNLGLDFFGAVV